MISSFVQKLVLIVLFITISCETSDTCNYSCLSKAYSYKDGEKDVASVTFTAKQNNGISGLIMNLVGYNIEEYDYQQVSVAITSGSDINTYVCERDTSGSTTAYVKSPCIQFTIGSSEYRDNTLYCSWTMFRGNDWPVDIQGSAFKLEYIYNYNILLANLDKSLMVAEDTKDLQIYQMNFLKCCNQVHGNDKVQLFVRQTDSSNDFNLFIEQTLSQYYKLASVVLTGSDSSQLIFDCYISSNWMDGNLKMDNKTLIINSQITNTYFITDKLCTWSIPISIITIGSTEFYETRNRVYDLKITLDDKILYTEKGISLNRFKANYKYIVRWEIGKVKQKKLGNMAV